MDLNVTLSELLILRGQELTIRWYETLTVFTIELVANMFAFAKLPLPNPTYLRPTLSAHRIR